eukprot:TRINITY_DN115121_c0_g1_i1.p2 TRINITY_DN115121_c0_g1~~TRINITY_DN115121_c0_g1_i1.p2  ORF type:complete len:143 (-),score=12.52 TRINITY_DN115121_c0_g1_i1:167-595(-)
MNMWAAAAATHQQVNPTPAQATAGHNIMSVADDLVRPPHAGQANWGHGSPGSSGDPGHVSILERAGGACQQNQSNFIRRLVKTKPDGSLPSLREISEWAEKLPVGAPLLRSARQAIHRSGGVQVSTPCGQAHVKIFAQTEKN